MKTFFKHPELTGDEIQEIGDSSAEALEYLQNEYALELERIFDLLLEDSYIYEGNEHDAKRFFSKVQ